MSLRNGFRITPRHVLGLFIALAGTLLLLDNFGVVNAHHFLRFWPVALIVLGIVRLARCRRCGGRGIALSLVLIGLGVWLLLDRLGYAQFNGRIFFPVLLLLVGLGLLFRRPRRHAGRFGAAGESGTADADSRGVLDVVTVLGSTRRTSLAQSLRGGSVTAVLGACQVDLRQCALAEEGALIDVVAVWGGVDILVPEDWPVVVEGTPILGSVANYTGRTPEAHTKRLVVRGVAFMGGIEVKNQAQDER